VNPESLRLEPRDWVPNNPIPPVPLYRGVRAMPWGGVDNRVLTASGTTFGLPCWNRSTREDRMKPTMLVTGASGAVN
jgi:hypothetical protein